MTIEGYAKSNARIIERFSSDLRDRLIKEFPMTFDDKADKLLVDIDDIILNQEDIYLANLKEMK